MGVFGGVKKAAALSKLKYDTVLLDRQIEAEKKKLGDELFKVMFEAGDDNDNGTKNEIPASIYLACRDDISNLVEKRQARLEELEHIEAKREERGRDSTAADGGGAAKAAGQWISTGASATKLRTEIAYYDREIRLRKEIFGVQVFDELSLMVTASEDDDSERGEADDPVLAVLTRCVDAVRSILQRKRAKENEMASL